MDDNSNSSVSGCMGVYRRIFYPLRVVVWLEPPAFQEEYTLLLKIFSLGFISLVLSK